MHASDEMYIPTALGILGYLVKENCSITTDEDYIKYNNEVGSFKTVEKAVVDATEFSRRRVTYCLWDEDNTKHPATYTECEVNATVLERASKEKCLFMRKFKIPSSDPSSRMDPRSDAVAVPRPSVITFLRSWINCVLQVGDEEKVNVLLENARVMARESTLVQIRDAPEEDSTFLNAVHAQHSHMQPRSTRGQNSDVHRHVDHHSRRDYRGSRSRSRSRSRDRGDRGDRHYKYESSSHSNKNESSRHREKERREQYTSYLDKVYK